MKKEYVVRSIDAASDGSPYVTVTLSSKKDLQNSSSQMPPTGPKVMAFSNVNDVMKDLNKMLSGMGGNMSGAMTSIKLDMHEYKTMNLSVGDSVFLELTKEETLGV